MPSARKALVLTSLKATHAGERLDRFELLAEIASGGMATVFLARLEGVAGFQRLYAIKRLHPHLANEGEFVDMFLDEARLAARIHHPNVVSILEVGTSEHGYYLVMEYIEGDTAARLLARSSAAGGQLPPGVGVRIAYDTLLGLHAAHELAGDDGAPLHIVHRDVSPQNILVGIDGVSRITDFGVAHAATRLSSTRTGQLKGKLAYMAPEQARGAAVDRRSDVFAMGVVLWELLAGKRLFKASNDAETLHRILFAPVPTLRGAGVDVSIPLDTACMRALEREPENRYASAAEFADELERVGRSLGVLSTTREIASYLDGAVGAEISQQREVVRGWLSRSEPSRNERPRSGLPPLSVPRPSSRDVTVSAPHARTEVSSTSSAVLEVHEVTTNEPVLDPPSPGAEGAKHATERAPASRAAWVVGGACALLGAVGLGFSIPHSNGPVASSAPASTGKASAASPAPPASVPAMAPAPRVQSSSVAEAPDAAPSSAPPSLARPAPPRSAPPRRTPKPSSEDPDDLARNPYR